MWKNYLTVAIRALIQSRTTPSGRLAQTRFTL
jgi:hypothetical protein